MTPGLSWIVWDASRSRQVSAWFVKTSRKFSSCLVFKRHKRCQGPNRAAALLKNPTGWTFSHRQKCFRWELPQSTILLPVLFVLFWHCCQFQQKCLSVLSFMPRIETCLRWNGLTVTKNLWKDFYSATELPSELLNIQDSDHCNWIVNSWLARTP